MVSETELKPVKVALEKAPQVAIIVLNWNAWDLTQKALESLRCLRYPNYEIILVDNGSLTKPDGFEKSFPNLLFVQTGSNLGYTGGNNAGIKIALARNADFILILNNDVLVEDPNLLIKLVTVCRHSQAVGIVAPRILQYTHNGVEIRQKYFGRIQTLLSVLVLGARSLSFRGCSWRKMLEETTSSIRNEFEGVAQVCGCAMLVSRSFFERIGYFDERLFMYDDEYDLCLRGVDAGFLVLQATSVSVTRLNVCKQEAMPSYRTYLLGRNRFLLAKKRSRRLHAPLFIGLHLVSSLKLALTLVRHRRWAELGSLLYGLRDGVLGRWGITPRLRILLMPQ